MFSRSNKKLSCNTVVRGVVILGVPAIQIFEYTIEDLEYAVEHT